MQPQQDWRATPQAQRYADRAFIVGSYASGMIGAFAGFPHEDTWMTYLYGLLGLTMGTYLIQSCLIWLGLPPSIYRRTVKEQEKKRRACKDHKDRNHE